MTKYNPCTDTQRSSTRFVSFFPFFPHRQIQFYYFERRKLRRVIINYNILSWGNLLAANIPRSSSSIIFCRSN